MSDQSQWDEGPSRLRELYINGLQGLTLQVAAELGVADLLYDGPRQVADLAVATSTDPDALYRLLRTLTGCGVFTEVEPGRFGVTPLGAHLCESHPQSMRALLIFGRQLQVPVFADAMHSMRTGTAAFPQTFGAPMFTYLQNHPEHSAVFDTAMTSLSHTSNAAVIDAYDFSRTPTVVDVAGGNGALLSGVLSAFPMTTGVLFEQRHVIDTAKEQIAAAGLTDRCRFEYGDFFRDEWPEGDVYLLKSIIHDWPDAQAVAILENCRRAMTPTSRVLLVEMVMPAGDAPDPSKVMDFLMLLLLGGRERTMEEHDALLGKADLRVGRVVKTASPFSIIEAFPV